MLLGLGSTAAAQPSPAPANPPAASAAVTSYPPSAFAASRPNTALDMVNNLPGFTLDTGGAVRGFGGAAGNVLIDGARPATKNDSLDEILHRIPASDVARIDVIRGAAPGIDMQGKTVIANVVRKTDSGLKLTTAVQGTWDANGHFDHGLRLEGSKRSGQTAYEASVLLASGADDGTGRGPRIVTDAAGHVTQTARLNSFGDQGTNKATGAVETPVLGGRLRIEGSFVSTPYVYTDDDTLIDPPGREYERYTQDQDTGEIGLRYERAFGPKASLELYGLQQLGRYASDDIFNTATDDTTFTLNKRTGESILRAVGKLEPSPNLSLETGAEGAFNWLTSRTRESDNGQAVTVPAANVHVTELRSEAFANATWRPRPDLTVDADLKVEASALTSSGDVVDHQVFVFPKPRVLVTWTPDKPDQVRMRLEREVGQLDFNYFTASGTLGSGERAGNPELTPQQDWVAEAAYDRSFWKNGQVSLTLRQYWIQDAIDFAGTCARQDLLPGNPPTCNPAAVFDAPANIGSATRQELAVALSLPTDKLWLKHGLLTVRATWRRSRVIDPDTHRPREISGMHALDAEIHFTQGLDALKSTWGFDIYPAWRQVNYLVDEVDTSELGLFVDAYFEYKPWPDLSVKVEGDNLSSHGLTQIRAFYDPFRDVNGGMLSSIDAHYPRFGPEFSVRVRKTFG